MRESLELAISQVPSWENLTSNELLLKLHEKTQPYRDAKKYDLVEVAKVIGPQNMSAFVDAVRSADRGWILDQAAVGFFPGEDPVNAELKAINSIHTQTLAAYTCRYISLLEKEGLTTPPSLQEVETVHANLKLLLVRVVTCDELTDSYYSIKEEIGRWNGDPLTKPKFRQ